ncbi:MAG TPA: CHAP domain-containing protein [Anaerolineaceae bacterium]|nr:CHAP domain-containing protein [Anaerolineaceae bacterium]
MNRFVRPVIVTLILAVLCLGSPAQSATSSCPGPDETGLAFTIDGVSLEGCFPPGAAPAHWIWPDPGQPVQHAYTQPSTPGEGSFSITAIPFGSSAPSEIFPTITSATRAEDLRSLLFQTRRSQGSYPMPGPVAQLFGHSVESQVSLLNMPGSSSYSVRLTEWLVIAGDRLWILRVVQPFSPLKIAPGPAQLNLSSSNLDAPSTSAIARRFAAHPALSDPQSLTAGTAADLPTPSWWSGTCDNNHYQWDSYANPYHYAAYKLGTSYRNVTACGPRPAYYEGPDVLVYFYKNAFPAYEWECVELSLRFMYLAYGVPPYPANGNGIVNNYSGSKLQKITNGTAGKAPVPGDVLSYCYYCTYGHTSVVISSNVNGSGNGSILVMEQNYSYNGQSTLSVSNWIVVGNNGPVYGWLHPTYVPPTPTPTPTRTPTPIPFTPNAWNYFPLINR